MRIGVNVHKSEARLQLFFDNFRLTLVNDGAQEIQRLYDAELAEAQAIDEAYLPEKFQAVLKQAIEMPVATLDERYAAYNALKTGCGRMYVSGCISKRYSRIVGRMFNIQGEFHGRPRNGECF